MGRDEVGEKAPGDEAVKGLRDQGVAVSSVKIMKSPINIHVQVSV